MDNTPPKSARERTTGVLGSLVVAGAILLRVLDWIGRGQTVESLNPFLHYLSTPLGTVGMLLGGFALVVWATKLEHTREQSEAPRIITDFARGKPEPVKRRWVWLKVAGTATIASLAIIGASQWILHKRSARKLASTPGLVKAEPIPPEPNPKPYIKPPMTKKPLSSSSAEPKPEASSVPASPTLQSPLSSQSVSQTPIQPPVKDGDPVACPALGTLATGWVISLEKMNSQGGGDGLPVESGPMRIVGNMDVNKLHPKMVGKFGAEVSQLRGSRYLEAKAFLDDVSSHTGTPIPRSFRPNEKLIRFVAEIDRNFQDSQQLSVVYSDGTFGESEPAQSGSVVVRIGALSAASQLFVAKEDADAKSGADKGCAGNLKYLKGEA